jgi:tetratricopeptide (TPR) repeat protein
VANSDPELLDRLSAALHLAAYGRLWSEPATWASAALARVVEGNHSLDALLLVAGGAANAADLDLARRLAESVLDATASARSKGTALEILSDVSMYTGRLDDCRRQTAELDAIGRSLADPHMIAIAAVNDALATTFGGAPEQALERLAGVWIDALPPSGAAWLAYANAEALSGLRSHDRAIAAYEHAIGLSRAVNNPFVMSVAQSSLAAEHARCRQHEPAYRAYADCLHGYLHHGNLVHAVVTLRNLVTLLHADRRSSEAAVLGTVATAEGLRPTHGDETEQLGTILAEIEASVTPDEYAGWQAEGRRLDLVTATRVAIGAVERRQ